MAADHPQPRRRPRIRAATGTLLIASRLARAALCGTLLACGGPERSLPHPLDYLQAGVEVEAEAEAIRDTLERAGWSIESELRGQTFIAICATRGEQSVIRVATLAGVGLALDSHQSDGRTPALGPLALVPPPRRDTHDLDADGREEIVVRQVQPARGCLGLFRVAPDGVVRALPWDAGELPSDACVESFADPDEDGRIEALARLRFPALALEEAEAEQSADERIPSVAAPLELGGDARFHATPPSPRYLSRARAALHAQVHDAASAPDAARVYRLAVEGAALERVAGSSRARQLEAFDEILTRVVLSEELAAQARFAREYVARGWSLAPESP